MQLTTSEVFRDLGGLWVTAKQLTANQEVQVLWLVAKFDDVAALVDQDGDSQKLVFQYHCSHPLHGPCVGDAAAVVAWLA